MSADESSEKEHEPTQKKLEEARKKGEIAKSNDLITAGAYAGFLVTAVTFGAASMQDIGSSLKAMLASANEWAGTGQMVFEWTVLPAVSAAAPWFVGPAVLALLSVLAQQAFVVAPDKLKPKLSRISPIEVAKQKFGRSGLFEFFKSFAKLSIYSFVLALYLAAQLPRILQSIMLNPGLIAEEIGRLTLGLLSIVLIIALALGVIDFTFQRADHLRKNRMSRKELTDEMKQSEGDPFFKQQRRQKGMDIAMRQMMSDVPDATVVIVNPTHFAVALQWERQNPGAPICVAKGVDNVALRIREVAMENGVPIHSDPPTARALFASSEIGDEIHPDHYAPVAAAIRFAEEIRRKAKARK